MSEVKRVGKFYIICPQGHIYHMAYDDCPKCRPPYEWMFKEAARLEKEAARLRQQAAAIMIERETAGVKSTS